MLRKVLEKRGYTVHVASRASDCLRMFECLSPNLVTMDLVIPGADGIATIRRLKEINPNVPIIIISASASQDLLSKSAELGVKKYIVKPFGAKEVVEAVQECLG